MCDAWERGGNVPPPLLSYGQGPPAGQHTSAVPHTLPNRIPKEKQTD